MTLLELVTYLRTNILDDNGGTGVDWTSSTDTTFDSIQLRWTNEELVANINEAIRQVYRRTNPIKDIYSIPVVINQNTYNLPKYILSIENVKRSTGHPVQPQSIDDLWELTDLNTRVGDVLYYVPDMLQNTIRFYPTPNAIDTISLLIYRLPITELSWDDFDKIPELRAEFHIPLLFYAAHLCYLKDEANTIDPNRASSFLSMFDREFPFTSAYSNIKKSRKTGRLIKYGGY